MGRVVDRIQTMRRALVIGGLIAALYYAFVYRGFVAESRALDADLESLAGMLAREMPIETEDRLDVAKKSSSALRLMETAVLERIALNPDFERRLDEPFQLVEFEIKRETLNDELIELAKANKVSVPPIPFERLPEYTGEMAEPRRLWGQLGIAWHSLVSAVEAGVGEIESIDGFQARRCDAGEGEALLDEVVLELTMTGSMARISTFLKSLPMDRREMERHGLKTAQQAKPAMFIDGLMLRKRPGANPDDVRLDLRLGGFIRREAE
jgi:hypothetical protein